MLATPISQLFAFPTCQCATLGHHICIFKFTQPPYSHRIKVRYKYLVLPLLVPKMSRFESQHCFILSRIRWTKTSNQPRVLNASYTKLVLLHFFFSLSLTPLSPIHILPKKLLVKPKHICVCDCYFY